MSVKDEFYSGNLDIHAWKGDWENGEWEMSLLFYPQEVQELESIGVTLDYVEWLYVKDLYIVEEACGSSGTWSEVFIFDVNSGTLKQYQQAA